MGNPVRLDGALTVQTDPYLRTLSAVAAAVEERVIVLLVGDGGTGKTFAVYDALDALGDVDYVRWQAQPDTTPKQTAVRLLKAATGVDYGSDERYAVFERLEEELELRPRLPWVDEAHNIGFKGLEILRHVWMSARTNVGMVLSGGPDLIGFVQRNSMMSRRVFEVVRFAPFDRADLIRVLPQWHPLYGDLNKQDPGLYKELFTRIYDNYPAGGNFGMWDLFTRSALRLMRQHDIPLLTVDVAQAVIAKRGGVLLAAKPKRVPPAPKGGRPGADRGRKAPRRRP